MVELVEQFISDYDVPQTVTGGCDFNANELRREPPIFSCSAGFSGVDGRTAVNKSPRSISPLDGLYRAIVLDSVANYLYQQFLWKTEKCELLRGCHH